MCSVFYHGLFETVDIVMTDPALLGKDIEGGCDYVNSLLQFIRPDDLVCSAIKYRCQDYKTGDILVLNEINQDELKVGMILKILVRRGRLYFVVNESIAKRHWLRYFKTSFTNTVTSFWNGNLLADYKPISNYGSPSNVFFLLHHHISNKFS